MKRLPVTPVSLAALTLAFVVGVAFAFSASELNFNKSDINGNQIIVHPSIDPEFVMTRLAESPDRRQIAIETASYESGGPIYLMDAKTNEVTDLISKLKISLSENQTQTARDIRQTWQVIGWQMDSQKILIAPADQGLLYWVDLKDNSYVRLPLSKTGDYVGVGLETVGLSSTGDYFVYVSHNGRSGTERETTIKRFDFRLNKANSLITLRGLEGQFRSPRVSPDGKYLAYLVQKQISAKQIQMNLHLLDLAENSSRLIAEDVGITIPVWSSDSNSIVFNGKSPSSPQKFQLTDKDWIKSLK